MRTDFKVRWSLGGSYGSVQYRGGRDVVKAAAERVARSKGIKCLVGPEIKGWVGVYPENNGQDQTVGAEIAREAGGEAIHLLVHDDDIFAYWFWRDGELIDSYWSQPGYFGEEQRAEQEAMAGRAEVFAHLLGDGVGRLRGLLERKEGKFTFEVERLEQFAKLLGISNAVTAYDYLKSGETEGIRKWKQFVEVPDDEIQAEKAAAREKKKRIKAEKKRLEGEGLLLYEEIRKGVIPRACRAGEGFMVGWHGMDVKKGELIQWHQSPWREARAVRAEEKRNLFALTSTPDGRIVVIAFNDGAIVWRSDDPDGPLREIPKLEWSIEASLSADGRMLAHSDREGVHVTAIENGERLATLRSEGTRLGFLHPDGQWLVVSRSGICLMAVRREAPIRELYIGGKSQLSAAFAGAREKAIKAINVDEMVEKWRQNMERGMAQAVEWAKKGKMQLSHEQMDAFRKNMEKGVEDYRKRLVEAQEGRSPLPIQGNETPGCVAFSRDGKRMWCGTDKGLRGYEWADVLAARGEEMPRPRWQFEPDPVNRTAYIYAVQEEAAGGAVVFAGYDGKVRRMELDSGEVREILTPPDGGAAIAMCLCVDESALGVITRPGFWEIPKGRDERAIWQVWNYRGLVAAR